MKTKLNVLEKYNSKSLKKYFELEWMRKRQQTKVQIKKS